MPLPCRKISSLLLLLAPMAFNAASAQVDFRTQVAPILQERCLRCHSDADPQSDLSLSDSSDLRTGDYIAPGRPQQSLLIQVVMAQDGKRPRMPQEGRTLHAQEIKVLSQWISEGAAWPDGFVLSPRSKADGTWWSLQPVPSVDIPDGAAVNPIDRFIQGSLSAKGLHQLPPADRRTQIRRLYFGLTGLPPTAEIIDAFVADASPDAYERRVDDLLNSKHLGEHWARHWLDISHYADTHGFERDKLRENAWRYRDYVIRSFNEDKPYDQFLREQIAGDILWPNNSDAVVATGFLAAGPWDFVGQVETQSPVLRRAARTLDLDDMVTQVMTATIGMTVNCARCHDHKLDPISQQEYYQLTAVFAGLKREDRVISESAVAAYNAQREKLEARINQLHAQIGQLQGDAIDLADIVGGGNGFGSGRKGLGIDVRTGKIQERPFGDLGNVQPGNFAGCVYDAVDGVFVPAAGKTQISSTGLEVDNLPVHSGKAWDMIRNGPVSSQYSTKLGPTDFNTPGHSMIGLHANAGITFDLKTLRSTGQLNGPAHFLTTAGYGGRLEEPSAELRVLVDGKHRFQQMLGRNDAVDLEIQLAETDRFLTLISTDGGNGYSHDQISLGDPRIVAVNSSKATQQQSSKLADLKSQRAMLNSELANIGTAPRFFGVTAEQPPAVHILTRGNPEQPGQEVVPGAPMLGRKLSAFGDNKMPEGERRIALVNWITARDNPLTARVIVNRLWHWHFGHGIVRTPSDFGYGGQKPDHPELLDWLSNELMASGWSLKHIHRLIVTSQTYRSCSAPNVEDEDAAAAFSAASAVDSENRLLWRMNARRLEAESVRDTVLAVSGKLNTAMYGPGYRDFEYEEAYAPIYRYITADAPELWKRSIYRFVVRTTPQQFLMTLDCPDPANLTPKRNVTTTPLQSLAMFNNDFMLKQAGYFAERLKANAHSAPEQVHLAFRLAFGRSPSAQESAQAVEFVRAKGLIHLCRVLFNANEFVYVD